MRQSVGVVSSRGSSQDSQQHDGLSVKALLEEITDLRDENEKLRQIQEQFWQLLYEKEDLEKEVEVLRSSNSSVPRSLAQQQARTQVPSNAAHQQFTDQQSTDAQKLRVEYDTMSNALQECLDLLMTREHKKALDMSEMGGRGMVHAFLSWLCLSHERASTLHSLATARDDSGVAGTLSPRTSKAIGVFSPTYGLGSISRDEKESLLRELHQTKLEVKQLQDELDHTDMSRLQALEDGERMQQQIEVLSKGVQELRTAYTSVKAQAEANAKNAQMVQTLKSQMAAKDALIHELKAKVSQLQRLNDIHGSELAADAARIKQDLAQRSSSQPGQAIYLSP